jgi:hypothetical protein
LDFLDTAMTALPPPLRAWSENAENRCVFADIPMYWQKNDVLTFLADTGMYHACLYHGLDEAEKEQVHQFKSEYFQKRFTVSRCILRQILPCIPGMEIPGVISLTREKNGQIRMNNRQDIFISLSYSGFCIAVTVGKQKIGSDIERIRSLETKKIRSGPLFESLMGGKEIPDDRQLLHLWTLLEAYAKFHDMSLYPLTADRFSLSDNRFVSWCIDEDFILTLASGSHRMKDALLWIDPACGLGPAPPGKKGACVTAVPGGDTYVRA